jgi:hypothetical protein
MKKIVIFTCLLLVCMGGLCYSSTSPDSTVFRAMSDELNRSMEKLKLDDEARPYFISYLVRDSYTLVISDDCGAITEHAGLRTRSLNITLRVGDYALDNSHFQTMQSSLSARSMSSLVIDDNYDVLRRQIWLETDGAYKNALETWTKKKAYLQNKIRTETIPDFTRGEAFSMVKEPLALSQGKKEDLADLVVKASRPLLMNGRIQKSNVSLGLRRENIYYVNSEGVRYLEPRQSSRLIITASTQADDGMPLKNFLVYAATPDGMPKEERLGKDIEAMVQELMALRSAPVIEDYSGPVLFEKQAAAEVLCRGFVKLLAAKPVSESDNPQMERMAKGNGNPFLRKVGARVIGESISVVAEPGRTGYQGSPLLGSYGVDEEGVKAREVSLIEGGFLKSFMMSRAPVKGFSQSNGHFRSASPSPSVTEFSSIKASGFKELKDRLIAGVRDEGLKHGYIIKSIFPPDAARDEEGNLLYSGSTSLGPSEFELSKPAIVHRVYPDGREELVRGAEFEKMNVKVFKSVTGISNDSFVYDYPIESQDQPAYFAGSYGSVNYATIITPSILFSEIDVKPSGTYRRLPLVSHPPH